MGFQEVVWLICTGKRGWSQTYTRAGARAAVNPIGSLQRGVHRVLDAALLRVRSVPHGRVMFLHGGIGHLLGNMLLLALSVRLVKAAAR